MTTAMESPCALCGLTATALLEPPRRTLNRGLDPDDDSYSITVMLPDVPLCDRHARDVREGDLRLGWCDDPECRMYGEAGEASACGAPYEQLASGSRSKSAPKRH
jgi:hypothetical protein